MNTSDGFDSGSKSAPDPMRNRTQWWGEFRLKASSWGHWKIGPLDLWIGRNRHDWQIACTRADDPLRDASRVALPVDLNQLPIPEDAEQRRVAYGLTSGALVLQPMLADRPVVARPEMAFSIPSGERVSVYVSSAVWVRISCGREDDSLIEIPTWRSSDTWFGDNRSGFLCYATRTTMRLEVDELPLRPYRAVTPIVIDNQGEDALNIERISLPLPNLSVFATPTGALWTERLHLKRGDDQEMAHVHIESHDPSRSDQQRLCQPREASGDRLLSRVFTGLFGRT